MFWLVVCLWLGVFCVFLYCCYCGERVDGLGYYGFLCCRSVGCISCYVSINDIICCVFVLVGVLVVLEFNGLVCDDGKRLDGMLLLFWKMGRFLVWDVMCVDIFVLFYFLSIVVCVGVVVFVVEDFKWCKYFNLVGNYCFELFGVEIFGLWGFGVYFLYKEIVYKLFDFMCD